MSDFSRLIPGALTAAALLLGGCTSPAARDHYDLAAQLTRQSREARANSRACALQEDADCVRYWLGIAEQARLRAEVHRQAGRDIQKELAQAPQRPPAVSVTSRQQSDGRRG